MTESDQTDAQLPGRTNAPYDAPDAQQLIAAVHNYLHDDLMPRSSGADRWLLRVAANALAIAGREIQHAPAHRAGHGARLAELGAASDRDLCHAIRTGDFDDRWDEVAGAVRAAIADSLSVANPGYANG